MRSDVDWDQINLAIKAGLIYHGNFEITQELIENVAFLKITDKKKFFSMTEAKRLSKWKVFCRTAALNLLKFKDEFDIEKSYRQAFVYIMVDTTNPNYYKIGRSIEPDVRVITANTFSPFKSFKIVSFRYSQDAVELEKYMHSIYNQDHINGEWFFFHDISSVVKKLDTKSTQFEIPNEKPGRYR